jgi:hypothetical protein
MRILALWFSSALLACDAGPALSLDASPPDDAGPADAAPPVDAAALDAAPSQFSCTRVIGHSQTNQWFNAGGAFESLVGGDRWELRWSNGATLEDYRDPASPVWSAPLQSACPAGVAVDRVVYNLGSFTFGDDLQVWTAALDETIVNIRTFHPAVRQIVLQPIIGGPGQALCFVGGEEVLASSQQPIAIEAIALVAGGDVIAGPSPEVRTCADYRDATGHLTTSGARAVGQQLGEHYRAP